MIEFKNQDIEEMLSKVRRIRCMHGPRFSMYDKVSKVQIYLDSVLGYEGNVYHVSLKSRKIKGYPQFEFQEGSMCEGLDLIFKNLKEALDIALTVARTEDLEKYIPKVQLVHYPGWAIPAEEYNIMKL
jgi:hypothetical protein